MNTMERIDLDAVTKIPDEDSDDVTLAEIGDALCTMAAQLDQLRHAAIADELRVLGNHLSGETAALNGRSGDTHRRRKMTAMPEGQRCIART